MAAAQQSYLKKLLKIQNVDNGESIDIKL